MKYIYSLIASALLITTTVNAQNIYTVAGNGVSGSTGDGGLAISAQVYGVRIAIDNNGIMYIGSANNNKIRKVDLSTGIITTYAGTGVAGFSGDGGNAINAQIGSYSTSLAVNGNGDLFFYDGDNARIRKIDKATGIMSTVAGNGTVGSSGDGGSALLGQLQTIGCIAVDDSDNIYIAEWGNSKIRKIEASTGIINTIVGTGNFGYTGDGGPALLADIGSVVYVCLDRHGNVYISSSYNVIRRIDANTGIITTIAGNGFMTCTGDGGLAVQASLRSAQGMCFDKDDNLYISDYMCNTIRKIDATTQVITTIAGTGTSGFGGDGTPAISAVFDHPNNMALDSCGNLYICDNYNYRIRRIDFSPGCFPVFTSINEIASKELSFSISPNPASSQLAISSSNKLSEISIRNILGQIVFDQQSTLETAVIDIADLQPGIYLFTATDINGSHRTQKLIKE